MDFDELVFTAVGSTNDFLHRVLRLGLFSHLPLAKGFRLETKGESLAPSSPRKTELCSVLLQSREAYTVDNEVESPTTRAGGALPSSAVGA